MDIVFSYLVAMLPTAAYFDLFGFAVANWVITLAPLVWTAIVVFSLKRHFSKGRLLIFLAGFPLVIWVATVWLFLRLAISTGHFAP